MLPRFTVLQFSLVVGLLSWAPVLAEQITSEEAEFFEKKIRPILAENCYQCHNSVDKKKGKLALDYRTPILESKVIIPGDPEKSPLIKALRHEDELVDQFLHAR